MGCGLAAAEKGNEMSMKTKKNKAGSNPKGCAKDAQGATIGAREARAVEALCGAMHGCTTAIRAMAGGFPIGDVRVTEALEWLHEALAQHRQLAASSGDGRERGVAWEGRTREAIVGATHVAEQMAEAVRLLASGRSITEGPMSPGGDPMTWLMMADAGLAGVFGLVPKSDFKGAIVRMWGRKEAPGEVENDCSLSQG